MSAQHIERDIEAPVEVRVDYIILDGRGGGTGRGAIAVSCGHRHLRDFCPDDLVTWKKEMAGLFGVAFAGVAKQ